MAGGIRWVGDKREREREGVCEATNCAINGALARRAPRPHDTENLCKTSHPPSDTQYMVFLLFDLRTGREERGALGGWPFPPEGIYTSYLGIH
jgi:hypothetical protein